MLILLLKLLATIFVYLIALVKDIRRDKRSYSKLLIGLLTVFMIISVGVIIFDNYRTTESSKSQTEKLALLSSRNDSLSKMLDSLLRLSRRIEERSEVQAVFLKEKMKEIGLKLEPFIKIAIGKYPDYSMDEALMKLRSELAETRAMAAPPTLSLGTHKVEKISEGYAVKLSFVASKRIPLGPVVFVAQLSDDTDLKILDIWPDIEAGGFMAADSSRQISKDGKEGLLCYEMMGSGWPVIDVKLSGPGTLTIKGSHNLKQFILPIGR